LRSGFFFTFEGRKIVTRVKRRKTRALKEPIVGPKEMWGPGPMEDPIMTNKLAWQEPIFPEIEFPAAIA